MPIKRTKKRTKRQSVIERAKQAAMLAEITDNLEQYSSPDGDIPITDQRLSEIFSDENLEPFIISSIEEEDREEEIKELHRRISSMISKAMKPIK